MRNVHDENLSEHSLDVAATAHALAVIGNKRFKKCVNAERAALLGLYHDAPEILTGDLPTPIKYHSERVRSAYKTVENSACETILEMLPDDMKDVYKPFFFPEEGDEELWKYVKAADKISALIKCIEEKKAGNSEFTSAYKSTLDIIRKMELPEADCFINEFLPAFELDLDELKSNSFS